MMRQFLAGLLVFGLVVPPVPGEAKMRVKEVVITVAVTTAIVVGAWVAGKKISKPLPFVEKQERSKPNAPQGVQDKVSGAAELMSDPEMPAEVVMRLYCDGLEKLKYGNAEIEAAINDVVAGSCALGFQAGRAYELLSIIQRLTERQTAAKDN